MKSELLEKLETLLAAENPLEVLKEFNLISAQFKNLNVATVPTSKGEDVHKEGKLPEQATGEHPDKVEPTSVSRAEKVDNEGTADGQHAPDKAAEIDEESPVEVAANVEAVHVAEGAVVEEEVVVAKEDASEGTAESPDMAATAVVDAMPAAEDQKEQDHNTPTEKAQENFIESTQPKASPAHAPHSEEDDHDDEHGEHDEHEDHAEGELSDEYTERHTAIVQAFRQKIADARAQIKRIEVETVATAKDLLAELQNLVEKEENIGKAFAGFNAIQEKWKSLPKVSNDNYRDLNVDYNKQVERFFYNINIYKELKELDLKRNLEEKQKVLTDQRNLLEVNDIRLLEVDVRLNQDKWNEIGPTFKENWDQLKDEFWSTTRNIYKRIQDFYNQRKEEQEKNLEAKRELLEKAKRYADLDLKANKKWQEKTNEVIELQKQWKLIGFVSKEQLAPVWKEFRGACDAFFEKKRNHYSEIHNEQEANKHAKEAVIAEAEELKDNTDWKSTSDKFIALQKKWKEVGSANQRDENRLWKRFRSACDHFFQQRNANKNIENQNELDNLKLKQEILDELTAFAPDPTKGEAGKEMLRTMSERWRAIGHVPFKEKDKINKAYRNLVDEKFEVLKVDRREKDKMRFEEKIDLLKSSDTKGKLIQKERDVLRSRISKIESEINQYENNLGFFANSKGADKLKAEVMKKIDRARDEVDELYGQLDMLNEAE